MDFVHLPSPDGKRDFSKPDKAKQDNTQSNRYVSYSLKREMFQEPSKINKWGHWKTWK